MECLGLASDFMAPEIRGLHEIPGGSFGLEDSVVDQDSLPLLALDFLPFLLLAPGGLPRLFCGDTAVES